MTKFLLNFEKKLNPYRNNLIPSLKYLTPLINIQPTPRSPPPNPPEKFEPLRKLSRSIKSSLRIS